MRTIVVLAVLVLGACRLERRPPAVSADLILTGGAVYTMSPERPWAEALVIRDGKILFVGDAAGAGRFEGPGTRTLALDGRLVLPGFHDPHAHPLSGGLELGECNLYEAETPAEVEGAIRAYAQAHPDLAWVKGNGWQLPVFPGANPDKAVLDRAVPDRPAFFYAADGHSAWVNSRALAMAGVTRETADPPNGRIERDRRTGEPTGTLRESAMSLVANHLPPYTREARLGAVRRGLAEANRFGITSMTDADVTDEYAEAYAEVDRLGELTAHVQLVLRAGETGAVETDVARLVALRERYRSARRLTAGAVKFYADGVIEARTAALLAPYLDRGPDAGPLVYQPEDLAARVVAFDRAGFQIHIHAIGDRAIRVSFDALAAARAANEPRDRRPVLAHIELFDPADIPRFRELGAIASFQPMWAQADEYITELTIPALGPVRSRWLYPIGSVLRSGAIVVGGSDWTVSSLNPLDAIQVALTRRDVGLPAGPAWIPEERATLAEMLQAYTVNGAYAARTERETGSLEPGKLADVIVLDRNLFATPVTEIHLTRILLTLLEGKVVWRDSSMVY